MPVLKAPGSGQMNLQVRSYSLCYILKLFGVPQIESKLLERTHFTFLMNILNQVTFRFKSPLEITPEGQSPFWTKNKKGGIQK